MFGRTGETVAPIWIESHDGTLAAGPWLILPIGPEMLDRRGDNLVDARLQKIGRVADVVMVQGITGNDMKSGWPMHGLQKLRERGLCRFYAFETDDPLEAEWIAAHTPVHAIVVPYTPGDMAARYRVFDTAAASGVAVISRAHDSASLALQRATPQLCASIANRDMISMPIDALSVDALSSEAVELLWTAYAADHPEPPKLRGVHPPESSG